jgi:hypothetical protein
MEDASVCLASWSRAPTQLCVPRCRRSCSAKSENSMSVQDDSARSVAVAATKTREDLVHGGLAVGRETQSKAEAAVRNMDTWCMSRADVWNLVHISDGGC